MAGAARKVLVGSFDPDLEHRPAGWDEAVENGAIGIYAEIIGAPDIHAATMKWVTQATERTRARHRAEANACLRAIGWRP